MNGYMAVNKPVVESKVASATLVVLEKVTPFLISLSIFGVIVSVEIIFL